jgi:hypothetical protein
VTRPSAKVWTPMRRARRRTLIRLGLQVGQGVALAAPVVGLLVFALVSFKPAVTLYALVVGPGLVLRHALEPARLRFEVQETVRRHLDGHHAH